MKKSKLMALLLSLALATGLLAGCGSNDTPAESTGTPAESTAEGGSAVADPDKPYAGTVLKYVVTDTQAEGAETQDLVAMVEEKTGIILDLIIINTAAEGEVDKTLVALQAGDELDIIYGTTSSLKTFYNAGVLTPLDSYASDAGYDINAVYSDGALPVYDDGQVYGLPAFSDIWLTFINTKWFEAADIEIPTADGWTWEKYVETAEAINNANLTTDDGAQVWGSFMETYNNYNYMLATQKGAEAYKADGSPNFDDPLYSEAMEWYNGLGLNGVQPDKVDMLAGTYAWNQFVASDDMAMFVCGGWVASMLPNTEQYPRDWECAILPMPYPEGEQPSTLSIPGCYAVPTTSGNKEAAFEAVRCIAENQYSLGYGRIPARKDLSDAEIMSYIEEVLITTTFANDAVTAEDIKVAWFDANRTLLPEKIIGTADGIINSAFKAEGDLYGTGSQDLETTMANIQAQAEKAIADAEAAAS